MAMAPRAWAQDSKDFQADAYMAWVLSEALWSREFLRRWTSALVIPVVAAGGLILDLSSGAGRRGFWVAIFRFLNSSYNEFEDGRV